MYYSTHLVAGATAGIIADNPVKGFILGLLSHVVLDMIPHHDHETVTNCLLDVAIGNIMLLVAIFLFHPEHHILWGAIGGVVPDIEVPLYHFGLIGKKLFPSHSGHMPHMKTTKGWSAVVQGLVIVLGLWILS